MTSPEEWERINVALDEILALPRTAWPAACTRLAANNVTLRHELDSLLARIDGEDPILDFPAGEAGTVPEAAQGGLAPGELIGAYRVIELLGYGGMGEVYRAERADGQFEHQVAIKLMRLDVGSRPSRFKSERQILARLVHPNIATLHDGGITGDGRAYMVMESVAGLPITRWCREHASTLSERLRLFVQVCDAVAYAHRKLIVHQDLKPGNILVTIDGRVKLLDFGIARLLGQSANDETRQAGLTPGYAAPEQLAGRPVTTVTDVYALGMLLFELVTGASPWGSHELPLAALVGRILHDEVPAASQFALGRDDVPVAPRLLAGDLDAIIAKAVRKEAESRYESVAMLENDVQRMLRCEPISAREGARWYIAGRFLRRHRLGVATATAVLAAVVAAAGGIAWQGHVAQREAARASAVKNFLVSVFRASDPRIASDKPRGQITAKELLDGSVGRIEKDFAGQPELQLEMMGIADDIYGYLMDDERYEALMKQRVSLAKRLYGDHHPIVIGGLITDAWASIYTQDFGTADTLLARADQLLREANLDKSAVRGEWWLAKARSLESTPGTAKAQRDALDAAIALFARYDAGNASYAAALANAARNRLQDAEYAGAEALGARAIAVEESSSQRDDVDLAVMYFNQGDLLAKLGRFDEAEHAYDRAAEITRRTTGEQYGTYWRALAMHASLLYAHGQRLQALAMFQQMLSAIPADWKLTTDDTLAREEYAACLTEEGRAGEAVPMMEKALRIVTERPRHDYDLRHASTLLGDAYEGAGRASDARPLLRLALDDAAGHLRPGHPAVLEVRERWARFLLDHPDAPQDEATARAALTQVIADGGPPARYTPAVALAHADLAMLALRGADLAAATAQMRAAKASLAQVQAVYDVRIGDELQLLESEVLAAKRQTDEARQAAAAGLVAAQGHDARESPGLQHARGVLAALPVPVR